MAYKCNLKHLVTALLLFGASVFVWNIYIYLQGEDWVQSDPFNKKIVDWPLFENCCSWWPFLHFIGFAILGYFFPDCWGLLFIGGILWELLEVGMNWIMRGTMLKQPMRIGSAGVEYSQIWWAGSFKDLFFNAGGILLGKGLRSLV